MGNQVKGAFTVRFIRTGDQIYVTRNVVKFDASGTESGAALFQAIDSTNGSINPDWATDKTAQPALKISVKSAMGNPVTVTDITWTWKGNAITFNSAPATEGDYAGWYLSIDPAGMFAKKITIVDNVCYCYLRFTANAASATVLSNQTIGFTINYTTSGMNDTVSGTEDVLIQQAGSDSYSVNITTDCSTLNKDQTSTTLTATCLYGVKPLEKEHTLEWYKDFVLIEGQTSKTLTVTRDDVDGSSVYSVKLLVGGVVKAVDAQRIVDEGDEWQVVAEPSGTSPTAISATSEAKYTLKLKKNGTDYSGTPTWTWTAYNALNKAMITDTSSTVTLTQKEAVCKPEEGQTYYSDVSVVAQATID